MIDTAWKVDWNLDKKKKREIYGGVRKRIGDAVVYSEGGGNDQNTHSKCSESRWHSPD